MEIGFVADSTVDLPDVVLEKEKIETIPLYINIGDYGFLDKVEMSRENFYDNLSSFSQHPTTAAPGINTFVNAYQRQIENGYSEILSFHISKTLSNTIDIARLAARKIDKVPIHVIDSGNLSMGTGLLLQLAVRMAEAGEKVKEILRAVQDAVKRTHTVAILDTLEYLRRSGRINNIQFGLASILFVKPIIRMSDGRVELERIRTKKRAMNRMIQILEGLFPFQDFAFVHTNAPEKVEQLKRTVSKWLPVGLEILTGEVTPVIGSHIGPGAFGFAAITSK